MGCPQPCAESWLVLKWLQVLEAASEKHNWIQFCRCFLYFPRKLIKMYPSVVTYFLLKVLNSRILKCLSFLNSVIPNLRIFRFLKSQIPQFSNPRIIKTVSENSLHSPLPYGLTQTLTVLLQSLTWPYELLSKLPCTRLKCWIERCNVIESFFILLQLALTFTFSVRQTFFHQQRYLLSAFSQHHSNLDNYITDPVIKCSYNISSPFLFLLLTYLTTKWLMKQGICWQIYGP